MLCVFLVSIINPISNKLKTQLLISYMKYWLISFFLITIVSSHLLSHFERQFGQIHKLHKQGDTSKAFSYAMKIFVAVELFEKENKIKEPVFLSQAIPETCSQLMKEVASFGNKKDWLENFQEIYARLKKLNSQCTNMDFKRSPLSSAHPNGFDDKCALCVVITKVIENYISVHNKDVTDFVQRQFCDLFEGVIRPTCEAFVHYAGPAIIKALLKKENADVICLGVGFCTDPKCRISQPSAWIDQSNLRQATNQKPAPWQWLTHIFVDKFGNGHLPPFDLDSDNFSDISTFRGYNWRGADCNELNKNIYPGRKIGSHLIDHDCNGIFGLNPKSGKTYENQFCQDSTRLGLAVIGDSAGAHFSIPQKYFNASMIKKGTYNDLLIRLANQLDIPQQSGYTGNTNTDGYVRHSVYKYLREWNLCNNNDYQNVAVNGGDSHNTWGNIRALTRKQTLDNPLLMFMELIGNDVCAKSFNGMTTQPVFKQNILKLLNYLNDTVPEGSHLMIIGLGDGDILYDNLHDEIHPLNVTYTTVYDLLNCLKISPCWGWLNSNATVRKFTTERAKNLSKVYQEIIDEGHTFKNFDIVYYDFPTQEILDRKIMEGGDPKDMIERCDGFHPNGQFHSYLADWFWKTIQDNHLDWIGAKNPHNSDIRKIFNLQILK